MKKKPKEIKDKISIQNDIHTDYDLGREGIILDERVKPINKLDTILSDMIDIASSIGDVLKQDKQNRREPNYELINVYTKLTSQLLDHVKE